MRASTPCSITRVDGAGRVPRRAAGERDDEDVGAEREDPGREDELHPADVAGSEQQHERGCVAQHGQPSRHQLQPRRDRRGRHREDGRHPHPVHLGQVGRAPATERPHAADTGACWGLGRCGDEAGGDGTGGEGHGDEEQPAAEEHGGEEAVLAVSDPVADRADEPQEGDPGDGRGTRRAERSDGDRDGRVRHADLRAPRCDRRARTRITPRVVIEFGCPPRHPDHPAEGGDGGPARVDDGPIETRGPVRWPS